MSCRRFQRLEPPPTVRQCAVLSVPRRRLGALYLSCSQTAAGCVPVHCNKPSVQLPPSKTHSGSAVFVNDQSKQSVCVFTQRAAPCLCLQPCFTQGPQVAEKVCSLSVCVGQVLASVELESVELKEVLCNGFWCQ